MLEHFLGLKLGRSPSIEITSLVFPHNLRLSTESEIVLDSMLGKLAHWLRLLGFRVIFSISFSDRELASTRCTILTRDRGLFLRRVRAGQNTVLLTCQDIVVQLSTVICVTTDTPEKVPVVRYCTVCGGRVREARANEVIEKVPPGVLQRVSRFWVCESCGKVYWCGSHHVNMRRLFKRALSIAKLMDRMIVSYLDSPCLATVLHKSRGNTL